MHLVSHKITVKTDLPRRSMRWQNQPDGQYVIHMGFKILLNSSRKALCGNYHCLGPISPRAQWRPQPGWDHGQAHGSWVAWPWGDAVQGHPRLTAPKGPGTGSEGSTSCQAPSRHAALGRDAAVGPGMNRRPVLAGMKGIKKLLNVSPSKFTCFL